MFLTGRPISNGIVSHYSMMLRRFFWGGSEQVPAYCPPAPEAGSRGYHAKPHSSGGTDHVAAFEFEIRTGG